MRIGSFRGYGFKDMPLGDRETKIRVYIEDYGLDREDVLDQLVDQYE